MKKQARWWWLVCAIAAGAVTGTFKGALGFLWHSDQTKITFAMLAIFAALSGYIGWLTASDREWYKRDTESLWFGADLLMRLGILTTVTSFIIMFVGAAGHLSGDAAGLQVMLVDLMRGIMTSLVGTFVGLVTSALIGLQILNLQSD